MSSITLNTARKMVKAYLTNPLHWKIAGSASILKGFSIPKEDVQEILDNSDTDSLMCIFGIHPDDVEKPVTEQNFAIILAGVDEDGEILTNQMNDTFKPCPPYCNNYSEIFQGDVDTGPM